MIGEYDTALDLLEILLDTPNYNTTVAFLKLYPAWDPLRDNPRFDNLITKYGAKD